MDGWMDGWKEVDGWMDGWLKNGWMGRQLTLWHEVGECFRTGHECPTLTRRMASESGTQRKAQEGCAGTPPHCPGWPPRGRVQRELTCAGASPLDAGAEVPARVHTDTVAGARHEIPAHARLGVVWAQVDKTAREALPPSWCQGPVVFQRPPLPGPSRRSRWKGLSLP